MRAVVGILIVRPLVGKLVAALRDAQVAVARDGERGNADEQQHRDLRAFRE